MEGEGEEEEKNGTTPRKSVSETDEYDVDIDEILLFQRFSRNELVLRFLSLVCLSFLLGLFLIQVDMLWRSRQPFSFDYFPLDEEDQFMYLYPDSYRFPHNEETWCWDPNTLLLRVNTSLFVH